MNHQSKENLGKPTPNRPNNNNSVMGFILVLFGIMLLFKTLNLGFIIPRWLFGWEMILIMIGVIIGVNSKFKNYSSIILIVLGISFLWNNMTGVHIFKFVLPIGLIIFGIYLAKKHRSIPLPPEDKPHSPPSEDQDVYDWDKRVHVSNDSDDQSTKANFTDPYANSDSSTRYKGDRHTSLKYDDMLKLEVLFSDIKRKLFSKNFLGGTVTVIFGSAQINFTHANIKDGAVIDIFQMFGSTKIIVPRDWTISTEVSTIMGDLADRRKGWDVTTASNKKLFIRGNSYFGSVVIRDS